MHAVRTWVLIVLAMFWASAYAAEAPGPLRSMVQPAARGQSAATADCPSKCMNGFSLIFERTSGGQCALKMSISCYPSTCAQAFGVCEARSCTSNAACASGAGCNLATGQCVPMLSQCSDAFTINDSTGHTVSCLPYACRAGACAATCNQPGDCSPGYQCSAGRCTK